MKRSHAFALSVLTLFLATSASSQAKSLRSGGQCQPAVADASMYGNCRLRIVGGQEVCRCAILPRARRLLGLDDRRDTTTGSITSGAVSNSRSLFSAGASPIGGGTASFGASRTGSAGGVASTGLGASAGGAPAAGGNLGGSSGTGPNGSAAGPGNNNGLGNGSEPADNTSTDVKGTDPSNPGGHNSDGGHGGGRGGNGGGNGRL